MGRNQLTGNADLRDVNFKIYNKVLNSVLKCGLALLNPRKYKVERPCEQENEVTIFLYSMNPFTLVGSYLSQEVNNLR
jgi:hypothetical protein